VRSLRHHHHRLRLTRFGYFKRLGPGLVTGASDDDPSGVGTYSQVGAAFSVRPAVDGSRLSAPGFGRTGGCCASDS
jgi:hypothetical protein